MLQGLTQNLSLECLHLESPALGAAVQPILKRNRRIRQVKALLVDEVATSRSVLGQALQRVARQGDWGMSARYLIVSRLLLEDEEVTYRYRVRKRRRLFERKRRAALRSGDSSSSHSS